MTNDVTGHKATSLLIVRLTVAVEQAFANAHRQQYDKPTNPYIDPVQKEQSS